MVREVDFVVLLTVEIEILGSTKEGYGSREMEVEIRLAECPGGSFQAYLPR